MVGRNNLRRAVALGLVALALVACQTRPEIHTQGAPDVNFAGYHTYGFVAKPSTDRAGYTTLTTRSIEASVNREMLARGYTLADNPDLLINFSVATKDKIEGDSGPDFALGYGRGRWGYGWGVGGYYNDIRTVTEGSLTLDVVEHARNELVWSGTAVGRIGKKELDNPNPTIDTAVSEIFKRYPIKPATGASH